MRERGLEIKVGAMILIALVLLGGFIFILGNFSLSDGYTVYASFRYSGNIHPGAPVKVSGIKVGKVKSVQFRGGKVSAKTGKREYVRLVVWLEDRVKDTVRQNAEFYVNTAGVLGEQYLEINPGTFDQPAMPPGFEADGEDPPRTDLIVARLFDVLDGVSWVLKKNKEKITMLIEDSTSTVNTVNALLTENKAQISGLLQKAEGLTEQGAGLIGDLRKGIANPARLSRTIANVESISATASRELPGVMNKANKTMDGVIRATGIIRPEDRDKILAALDQVTDLTKNVNGITRKVGGVVDHIRAGKGTAGAFVWDDAIYLDLKEMVRDLKRNPWKFLWKE
ncbi:MAG: MCE family protein [Deltaproteobacteria bacterium]|nr:MCE family protein [Deltaproteobacteria bacterium]